MNILVILLIVFLLCGVGGLGLGFGGAPYGYYGGGISWVVVLIIILLLVR